MTRLTPAQIQEVVEMREAGVRPSRIARRFNVSPGCIAWQCLRLGATPEKMNLGDRGPPIVRRGDHEVRRFTAEEDENLLAWSRQGVSYSEMGRRLYRAHNSCMGRLMTLARREDAA